MCVIMNKNLTDGVTRMIIKKFVAILVVLASCVSLPVTSMASGMIFDDVSENVWYYNDVKTSVDLGLINGKSENLYCPDDNLTYAEAIKLAACMNQLYTEGEISIESGTPWYKTYLDYCVENEIVTKEYNYNDYVTRAGYMGIFASALPDDNLSAINLIPDNSIPDVPSSTEYSYGVYKLYRAGILQGTDSMHSCNPFAKITRAEVAAILTRMMNKDKRIKFSMENKYPTSITMYAADGRTESVLAEDVPEWESVGWYQYPVCYVYSTDGRAQIIPQSDVDAWLAVGWFETLDVTVYSADGKTQIVSLWDVELWKQMGWYTEPVYEIYDEGKVYRVTLSQVQGNATLSVETAEELARNFYITHKPLSSEDIRFYVEKWGVPESEIYSTELVDYNANSYLIGISVVEAVEFVSVNKNTGAIRYCGGGQNYWRGMVDF